MKELLHNPKKRRMLLIGGVAAGGLILFLLLHKKSTGEAVTTTGASEPVEQVPVEGGGGALSGAGTGTAGEGQQELINYTQAAEQQQLAQQEAFANFLTQLSASQVNTAAKAETPTPNPGPAGAPLATAHVNNQPGNPRAGEEYKTVTINGKTTHEYDQKVPGGVGPNGNLVIVSASRSPSQPPAVNQQTGNPREGQTYKTVTYKGKKAHEYTHAVKGGVGPEKNLIIL